MSLSLVTIVKSIVNMFKMFHDQIPMSEFLRQLLLSLFGAVDHAISGGQLVDKETVDNFLTAADLGLGSDVDAKDLIKDLPADKEEELTDHIIEAVRIYAYSRLKVKGYFVEGK